MLWAFRPRLEKGTDFYPRCLFAGCWISFVDHECLTVCRIPRQKPDVSIRAAIKLSAVCHFAKYPSTTKLLTLVRAAPPPDRRG